MILMIIIMTMITMMMMITMMILMIIMITMVVGDAPGRGTPGRRRLRGMVEGQSEFPAKPSVEFRRKLSGAGNGRVTVGRTS